MGNKGGNKTKETYTPNAAVGQSGTQALTMAQNYAQQPFQQQVAPVAGLNADQQQAFQQVRDQQGFAQPYMNKAKDYFDQSAQPISAGQVQNYLNPYANYVMSGMQDVFGQQNKQFTGSMTQAAGGVGADRIGVAQANLGKQQGLAAGQTMAGLYQPALAAAQQDAARQQSAAYGFGQLGTAAQNAAFQGSQALMGTGNQQQAQSQNEMNAPYQWDLARIQHPGQMAQYLSGINAQTAPSLGGTTTKEYPGQSPWGTIAGLGMTAAGAYMGNPGMMAGGMGMVGGGGKGSMGGSQTSGMTAGGWGNTGGGYNPNVSGGYSYPSARGGAVPYSGGGAVNPFAMGQRFQTGGDVLDLEQGLDGSFGIPMPIPRPPEADQPPAPRRFPGGIFGGLGGDPYSDWTPTPDAQQRIQGAFDDAPNIPTSMDNRPANVPPPGPMSGLPPEITGQDQGLPPQAQAFAAPSLPRSLASPGTGGPAPVNDSSPYGGMQLPPDPGEGSFARSPGAALMNAGFATMAAAGKRDSRGLPTPPFAAIGEGGMEGIKTLKAQDTSATQRRRVDLEARRLLNQAEHQRNTLGETRRYHDIIDRNRQDTTSINNRRATEQARHNQELERRAGDPSRLTPVQQAIIRATEEKGSPLTPQEIGTINDRMQREQRERPNVEQEVLRAAEREKGSQLTRDEMIEILGRVRQTSRNPANPPRPMTAEAEAIAAKKRELGRDLTSSEVAAVAREVKEGPPRAPGEAPSSNILGDDDIAPNFQGATGLGGSWTNLGNKVTGALGSQVYPAEAKATRILNDLAIKTQTTLQNVQGRPSNYWLGRIGELTVRPNSWSEGPQGARQRLETTLNTISAEADRLEREIIPTQTTKANRDKANRSLSELRGLEADYRAVIKSWTAGGDNPLTPLGEGVRDALPPSGAIREGARDAAAGIPKSNTTPSRPPGVPVGSKYSASRKVWRTPDGQIIPHP